MKLSWTEDKQVRVETADKQFAIFGTPDEAWSQVVLKIKPGEIIVFAEGLDPPVHKMQFPKENKVTEVELQKLAESLSQKMEPIIRSLVEDILEETTTTMLQHLAHELDVFAKMRKNRQI